MLDAGGATFVIFRSEAVAPTETTPGLSNGVGSLPSPKVIKSRALVPRRMTSSSSYQGLVEQLHVPMPGVVNTYGLPMGIGVLVRAGSTKSPVSPILQS